MTKTLLAKVGRYTFYSTPKNILVYDNNEYCLLSNNTKDLVSALLEELESLRKPEPTNQVSFVRVENYTGYIPWFENIPLLGSNQTNRE